MNGTHKPKKDVKDAKRKESSGDGNADKDEKQCSKRHAGTRVHEESLENTESVTYSSVVAAVETFLPLHPVGRRFVVSFNHLHLMDPFPKNHHVLVHHSSSLVVVVATHGGLFSPLSYGGDSV